MLNWSLQYCRSNITTIKEEGSPFPGSKTDDVNGFFASNKSSKSNENFFDLNGNEDIWGPQFLREGNKVVETTPFSPDLNVETIGGAYVDVERSIPLNRGDMVYALIAFVCFKVF